MAIITHNYPVLEYDDNRQSLITPSSRLVKTANQEFPQELPQAFVVTFMRDALKTYIQEYQASVIDSYDSETGVFPIYLAEHNNQKIGLAQIPVGAAAAAIALELLIAKGATSIIACGGCGTLSGEELGQIFLPTAALRDEALSYKYLPPSRWINPDSKLLQQIIATLQNNNQPHSLGKCWTTDAFFRETPDLIAYRKSEGCEVVDMECSALAAVAQYRGIAFAQMLYSGDSLDESDGYKHRGWIDNLPLRIRLLYLAIEAASAQD